jgi:hypothetical protein
MKLRKCRCHHCKKNGNESELQNCFHNSPVNLIVP